MTKKKLSKFPEKFRFNDGHVEAHNAEEGNESNHMDAKRDLAQILQVRTAINKHIHRNQ